MITYIMIPIFIFSVIISSVFKKEFYRTRRDTSGVRTTRLAKQENRMYISFIFSGVIFAIIVALIIGIISLNGAASASRPDWNKTCNDRTVLVQRRDDLTALIRAELDSYQDFETGIIDSINPQILLSYPQITSNKVLLDKVNALIEINDTIYQLQLEQNTIIKDDENRNNGFWIPAYLVIDGNYKTCPN